MSLPETPYQRQLSDLVTEVIFGKCAHSEVSPASAKSYAMHNSSKCVCNKCHRKMYYSELFQERGKTQYASHIELAHDVINEIHRRGLAQWLKFVDCFEQGILDDLTPKVTTHTVIDYMMTPEFICRTALKSYQCQSLPETPQEKEARITKNRDIIDNFARG